MAIAGSRADELGYQILMIMNSQNSFSYKSSSLILLIVCLIGCNSRQKSFQDFQSTIKQSVDPQKLQEWAKPIIAAHDVGFELPIKDFPTILKMTNGPSSAFISYCDKGGKALFISWGGGFGHWGIIVGESNCIVQDKYPDRPIRDWVPGVYFFTQN